MNFTKKIYRNILLLSSLSCGLMSCNKMLEVTPKYIVDQTKAFATTESAEKQIAGLYLTISTSSTYYSSINYDLGLVADELLPYGYNAGTSAYGYLFYNYLYSATNDAGTSSNWSAFYNVIYACNMYLQGIEASTGLTTAQKAQYKGEVLTWRAFSYYYLVNSYGAVPHVTNGDWNTNTAVGRTSVDSILQYCAADLTAADSLLSDSYPSNGRFRINQSAADALLSRVYLSKGNYAEVVAATSKVLSSSNGYNLSSLDSMYSTGSSETILAFAGQYNYFMAAYDNTSMYASYAVTNGDTGSLYDQFADEDLRKTRFFITQTDMNGDEFVANYKYTNDGMGSFTDVSESQVVFKLDEMYLNRAEAYARINKVSAAVADLNVIRERAGLEDLSSSISSSALVDSILQERRKELCFEWGDRWITLKRTGLLNSVMKANKPTTWKTTAALFPISLADIRRSKLTQNPGY